MRIVVGQAERGPAAATAVLLGAIAVLAFTVLTNLPGLAVTPIVVVMATVIVAYRTLLSWPALVLLTVLVILFIPIRRYTMAGDLPFELEPYRLLVAFIIVGWATSILIDPRVRLRMTGFEGPIALILAASVASLVVNPGRVGGVETEVVKKLSFLISFVLILYLLVSVLRTWGNIDLLTKTLVAAGAGVAVFALVEARTGYNAFDNLPGALPFLTLAELPDVPGRGARLRVYASAQHPIALGAVLVMLLPFGIYLARRQEQRRWWLATFLLGFGALATVSRTAVLMFAVTAGVFFWLRPVEVKRLWPLVIPGLVAVHVLLPGTLGSLKEAFQPPGGLIAEQQTYEGYPGSGRVADLGPALEEYARNPLLGQGFATRITDPRAGGYANILDDQWLGTLLETGLVGVLGWAWLFWRAIRRFGRVGKEDSDRGWLLTAITAAIAAYAVGMFVYDAFAFIQVTFVLFFLLALGIVALGRGEAPAPNVRQALP